MISDVVVLIGWYVLAAVSAQVIHASVGVLTEGYAEVRRQITELYEQIGPAGYAVFVLTAGILVLDRSHRIRRVEYVQ